MSANFGLLCKDVIAGTVTIKDKRILDKKANLRVEDAHIRGNATICGTLKLKGNIVGDNIIEGNLVVCGDQEIKGDLSLLGDVNGNLTVNGDEVINGDLIVSGNISAANYPPLPSPGGNPNQRSIYFGSGAQNGPNQSNTLGTSSPFICNLSAESTMTVKSVFWAINLTSDNWTTGTCTLQLWNATTQTLLHSLVTTKASFGAGVSVMAWGEALNGVFQSSKVFTLPDIIVPADEQLQARLLTSGDFPNLTFLLRSNIILFVESA